MGDVEPIGREDLFPLMTTSALIAWVSMAEAQYRMVPAALAELCERQVSYPEIARRTGIPDSTVHDRVTRYRSRSTTSGETTPAVGP